MPRQLRVQYPGAIYHVMHWGDRRQSIFADDEGRERFLKTLGQCRQKAGWRIAAAGWDEGGTEASSQGGRGGSGSRAVPHIRSRETPLDHSSSGLP